MDIKGHPRMRPQGIAALPPFPTAPCGCTISSNEAADTIARRVSPPAKTAAALGSRKSPWQKPSQHIAVPPTEEMAMHPWSGNRDRPGPPVGRRLSSTAMTL